MESEVENSGEKGGMLESALIDQRMIAERHKSNFDTLKTQHIALQEVWYRNFSFVLYSMPTVFIEISSHEV